MRVAIFDFDGTLYSKDTYQLLMDHLKEHPLYHTRYNKFFRTVLPPYIGTKLKVYPKEKMRNKSMQVYLEALKGLTVDELDTYFEEIAHKMHSKFNKEVLSKLEQHAADDIHIMLVSGAYSPLLHIVTKDMPIDTIIGTDIPVSQRVLNTKMPLNHVQGIGKNEQIDIALANKEIDWENSFAYADSYSDLPVLELVGNPVAVLPDKRLHLLAKKRQWTIM